MDGILKDVTGIAMAIVGVAILYTLVNPNNRTAQVISAAAGGFSQSLSAAMGGGTRSGGGLY
jgi:succinate dehydrogenase hydrophobic anchor subunit